ncbi:unnamed protein product [Cyclocybe aegerita]|uniref:Reverse transcriptase Ty1/copia-type domain-containing protein n=1 Tax=Cyclocybe aegerita TaxID=1973307 RepID=A0A8S0X5V2_CYCAE|nr:unnamed protein product [Cyclocybe aegerita]
MALPAVPNGKLDPNYIARHLREAFSCVIPDLEGFLHPVPPPNNDKHPIQCPRALFVWLLQVKVLHLRKSLYGLKQAAHQWNKKLHAALVEMGFKRIEADCSVYIYSNGVVKIIVPIYVDDITFASKSNVAIDKAVKDLCTHFKCCDLGSTKFLLGVGIGQDKDKKLITLHQHSYGTWYCLIQGNGS